MVYTVEIRTHNLQNLLVDSLLSYNDFTRPNQI